MFYSDFYTSPVGKLFMTSDGTNLTGLWIEKQKYFAATAPQECREKADLPVFIQAAQWLDKYFQKQNPAISELPLAPEGGEFRQMIWKILCDIPLGQVRTYGGIAKMVARKPEKPKCRRKPSAEQSVIIRFPLLSPATGSSEQTAA